MKALLEQMDTDWSEGKLWLLTAALNSMGGGKVWEDLKATIRMDRGRLLKHTFRAKYDQKEGKASTVTNGYVLDLESCLPAKKDKEGKMVLDVQGNFERFDQDWSAAALRASHAWFECSRRVKGEDQ